MTDEKSFQCPICATHQWSAETIGKPFFGRLDGLRPHQKTWHFLTAGVPISSKRPRNKTQATDSGTQDCVCRKASGQFDPPAQTTGQINGRISERSGGASLRRISQKAKAWLRNLIESFRCNISLTGPLRGSFLKSIVCWFRKEIPFIVRKKYV